MIIHLSPCNILLAAFSGTRVLTAPTYFDGVKEEW